jgi:tetratricopeptide (TPR) repeat protein
MRYCVTIIVFLLFSMFTAMSQVITIQGPGYLLEEQYGRAKAWFLEKLKESPGDVHALVGLGDTYLGLNNPDSARIAFQKAASLNPGNPSAWTGMGKVALLKNDLRGESEYFDRARRAGRASAEVCSDIAEACISYTKKDTSVALLYQNLGLSLNPKLAALHLSSGNLAMVKKKYGEAVNAYERALFFDPESALAYRRLGCALSQLRNYKDALNAFNKSVGINPAQILVYRDLGNLYYSAGKYPEAAAAFRLYMSRAEISTDDKEQYAILLFFNKRYEEASGLLEEVLSANRNESVLLRLDGYIAFETGDYLKGLKSMRKFFSLHDPGKIISSDYLYYARILGKTGNDSLAMAQFKKAIALDPDQTEAYEELAKLASRNHRHAEAAGIYLLLGEKGADRTASVFLAAKEFYFAGNYAQEKFDSLSRMYRKQKVPIGDSVAMKQSITNYYCRADSAFSLVNQLNKDYAGGYLWKGRVKAILDPEGEDTGAKVAYENALGILRNGDQENNKKMIVECYRYLGYFYFREYERVYKKNKQKSAEPRSKSIEYFSKIVEIDPADKQANAVIHKMKQQ